MEERLQAYAFTYSLATPSERPQLDHGSVDPLPRNKSTDDEAPSNDPVLTLQTQSKLCQKCSNLNLKIYFQGKGNSKKAGFLKDLNDPTCAFCALVSKTVSLYWIQRPHQSNEPPTKLFLRSKFWYSTEKDGRQTYHPRLLLAVNAFPPGYSLGRPRMDFDNPYKDRFVLAELEVLPSLGLASGCSSSVLAAPRLRRDLGPRVDTKLIIQWIEDCKHHSHSRFTEETESNSLFQCGNGFRLIDTIENCLVQQQTACEYVALSYVWGNQSSLSLKCTRSNISQLSRKQALTNERLAADNEKQIPATIQDAMELVRTVGLRYLWVDALCILQDDEDEKERLIHGMNCVYENATVTVIACAGNDAAHGLPGITTRNYNTYDELTLIDVDHKSFSIAVARSSLLEQVHESRWNTRGWTYQEQCLSRRCLYFTPHEVFFVCKECQWREGYSFERLGLQDDVRHGPPFWNSEIGDADSNPYLCLADQNEFRKMDDYFTAVTAYSRRNLTFPNDILNAFSGIFNKFSRNLDIVTAQGIPSQYLPDSLLWYPETAFQKRSSNENVRNYSSWSWCCWQGPTSFVHSAYPFQPATLFDLEYVFSSEFYYAIDFAEGNDEKRPSMCWTKTVVPDDIADRKSFTNNKINIKKPQEAERGPPPDLNPTMGELCFWAPVLRINSETSCMDLSSLISSPRHLDSDWQGRVKEASYKGKRSVYFFFDDENQTLRQTTKLILLGTAIPFVDPCKFLSATEYAEYVRCVYFLCVEMQDNFYIRKGIGVMYMMEKLCREDYWSCLLGKLFEDYEWQFIRLR